jgi:hypothetical protein
MQVMSGCDQVGFPSCIWPEETIGCNKDALAVHEALLPLTKNVNRMPVSAQKRPSAATSAVLHPSSTVSAI